jgi:hypothetical protein
MSKHKEKHSHFVMVTYLVLDSPAWRAMSMGARCLYIALKRRYFPNNKNNGRIYLPQSIATRELGTSPNQIVRWFEELEYYGFIVKMRQGHLGLEGRGRAAQWRLTEVAYMRGTSSKATEDMPTREFLRWNGAKFSGHNPGGDHLKKRSNGKTESHYGKPLFGATENRSDSATENRSDKWNFHYGKPGEAK